MTAELLDALLLAYYRGKVSQEDAARLLEMRKADFADLATVWAVELVESAMAADTEQVERVRQGVEWRAYLRRFLATFPECDPRCIRHDTLPCREHDSMMRPVPHCPVSVYGAKEAAALPPAQPALTYSGTDTGRMWENMGRHSESVARAIRRAPEQTDDEESDDEPELTYDGPEFAFADIAEAA